MMQTDRWRENAELLLREADFNLEAASALLRGLVREGGPRDLVGRAEHALLALRAAGSSQAGLVSRGVARRAFEGVFDHLQEASTNNFGRRTSGRAPGVGLLGVDDDDRSRRDLLGLPPTGMLDPATVRTAFRQAARWAHPDMGGHPDQFLRLTRARDTLLTGCDAQL